MTKDETMRAERERVGIDHQQTVLLAIIAAKALTANDLPEVLRTAERSLDVGALFHPTAWIQNHKKLEEDIATLRAAMPLYLLGKKLEAMAAAATP